MELPAKKRAELEPRSITFGPHLGPEGQKGRTDGLGEQIRGLNGQLHEDNSLVHVGLWSILVRSSLQ